MATWREISSQRAASYFSRQSLYKRINIKKLLIYFIGLALLIISIQGCSYSIVTEYEDCVSPELTFNFKDDINLYIIDDSTAERKYSSMNFEEGEYFLCTGENCLEHTKSGFKYIPINNEPFHLTGKYRTNIPKFIASAFRPKTFALQADMNNTKVWLSLHEFEKSYHKKEIAKNIVQLKKKSILAAGWHLIFECPNQDVEEVGWTIE